MPDDIMWVHLKEPEPDEIVMTSPDAVTQRVWFHNCFRNATGAIVLRIHETAALMLKSCENNNNFKHKH